VGFLDYVKAAFSAKPKGMLISPNWIMVAAFGLLGVFVNPGFLILGAGIELAYLFLMGTNKRYQKFVDAVRLSEKHAGTRIELDSVIGSLTKESRDRFHQLNMRCASILDFYSDGVNVAPDIFQHHTQSLNKFVWIFLQLLIAKETIMNLVKESKLSPRYRAKLEEDATALQQRIEGKKISAELKKSLESQRDIVLQRLHVLGEAEEKMLYVDAELSRVEQQVELLREQAVVSKDAQAISTRIDTVSSSLGETTDWIKEQQSLFGSVQDLTDEPPPLIALRQTHYERE
jgi:hypothetical protein